MDDRRQDGLMIVVAAAVVLDCLVMLSGFASRLKILAWWGVDEGVDGGLVVFFRRA